MQSRKINLIIGIVLIPLGLWSLVDGYIGRGLFDLAIGFANLVIGLG